MWGFVLIFDEKPEINLADLGRKIREIIEQYIDVAYYDEYHIKLGDYEPVKCSGPRIHITNTREIENFRLLNDFTYNHLNNTYALVGLVGWGSQDIGDLNKPHIF